MGSILHFKMKFRLYNVGLPVKWFMMPTDDFRMWRTYLIEAPRRQWPIWPFYAYRVNLAVFVASAFVVFLNMDKVDAFLRSFVSR